MLLIVIYSDLKGQDTVSRNKTSALSYFVDGKISELKEDYKFALEYYKTALKYENSPAIYFAVSRVNALMGRFQDALIDINNALKISPDKSEYLEQKARIYYASGKLDQAAMLYEKLITINPDNPNVLYSLARIYQDKKLPSKAVEMYEKITDVYGFDIDVLRRMYEIYYNYKEYENCARVLEYMLKIDPYNIQLLLELASFYDRLNKHEESRDIYEQLFYLNPDNKQIRTEMVKSYFRNNKVSLGYTNFAALIGKDSLSFYEKVQLGEMYYNMISQDLSATDLVYNIFSNLQSDYPNSWEPNYYLGQIYLSKKDNENASKYFEKAYEFADTSSIAYLQLGYSFFNIANYQKAAEVLSKGLNYSSEDFRMNYFYALSLQRIGNESEAMPYLEKSAELKPDDVGILSTLAMAYNSQKKYKESDAVYEKALLIDPENALVLNNYAYNLSVREENLERALEMSRISLNKEPGNPSYLDTYGWILYKLKDYKNAADYIEKAVSINSSNWVLLDHLGDVYFALKNTTKAIYYWKKALELNPGNKNLEGKIFLNNN